MECSLKAALHALSRDGLQIGDHSVGEICLGLIGKRRHPRFVTPFGKSRRRGQVSEPAIVVTKIEGEGIRRVIPYSDRNLVEELQGCRPDQDLAIDPQERYRYPHQVCPVARHPSILLQILCPTESRLSRCLDDLLTGPEID